MEVLFDKLGIVEYRNILSAVNQVYNVDFSEYALTSLKRRIEKLLYNFSFKTADDLILKLQSDAVFFEVFLKEIAVEDTEMFRDPPMWQDLKENVLPKYAHDADVKIWMPDVGSGDELFSLLIMLKESFILEKVKIIVSSISQKCIDHIKTGVIDLKKIEVNTANYRRIKGEFQLTKYIDIEEKKAFLNQALLKDVNFVKGDFFKLRPQFMFKLIVFRNKMLYYNPQLQCKALEVLNEHLLPGGYLVTGINETIENCPASEKFSLFNPTENIYKKNI